MANSSARIKRERFSQVFSGKCVSDVQVEGILKVVSVCDAIFGGCLIHALIPFND